MIKFRYRKPASQQQQNTASLGRDCGNNKHISNSVVVSENIVKVPRDRLINKQNVFEDNDPNSSGILDKETKDKLKRVSLFLLPIPAAVRGLNVLKSLYATKGNLFPAFTGFYG